MYRYRYIYTKDEASYGSLLPYIQEPGTRDRCRLYRARVTDMGYYPLVGSPNRDGPFWEILFYTEGFFPQNKTLLEKEPRQ